MFIQQLYTNCLSEAAYYIEDKGEAAIIDPLRDTAVYTSLAAERHARIKFIFETHFHADFVSGHLELQQQTGAPIVYGPTTVTSFPATVAKDGEVFRIGDTTIEVLHTPGHTLESVCYLLRDASGKPHCIFTGDTLFVGDVGRPDLSSGNMTSEQLAGMLYESLQKHIKSQPDDVIVYPAHGPGSACGKNIGPDAHSTIGEQKRINYALLAESKEDFVKAVTTGLDAPPDYFFINARINQEGYAVLKDLLGKSLRPLSVEDFKTRRDAADEPVILDTRHESVFTEGFIPGSVFIGLHGRYAEWAGSLLPYEKPVLLVTEPGREEESIIRLARVGLDRVVGYLEGGYDAWKSAGETSDMIINVEADELAMDFPFDEKLVVVDVRKETEFADGHVEDAQNLPLGDLADPGAMASLDEGSNLYVHCAGGYRSVIACSLMKRQGFHNLRNVIGGWASIKAQEGIPVVKDSTVLN